MTFPTRIVLLLASITCASFPALARQTSPPANPPGSNQPAQNAPAPSTPTASASAQQSSTPQSSAGKNADQDKGVKDKDKGKPSQSTSTGGKVAGTSNDRLFYTLPNFLTLENSKKLPPLTTGQKFKVVALGTFDPIQYPWWGLLSAISQSDNSESAYGQGWASYGKRYGTTAADSTIENFMVGAVFPSILHQDPRFYQSAPGGFGHRTGYAISRIFVTRTDSGHSQFNYSEIVGSALSAAISTYSYHPRSTYLSTPRNPHLFVGSDRTLDNAGGVWATQVSLDTITLAIKEFWPDVHRKMAKKHSKPMGVQPAGANP
ncbi:MAG TPA: hypothetical protein VIW68_11840 [Candidatus Sulfotelmatobacter sp.]